MKVFWKMAEEMESFRILHIESSTGVGGQELRTLSEAKTMMSRGHFVLIVAQPESFLMEEAKKSGIQTATLRMNWWSCGFLMFQVLGLLKKYHIQVLVTHGSVETTW